MDSHLYFYFESSPFPHTPDFTCLLGTPSWTSRRHAKSNTSKIELLTTLPKPTPPSAFAVSADGNCLPSCSGQKLWSPPWLFSSSQSHLRKSYSYLENIPPMQLSSLLHSAQSNPALSPATAKVTSVPDSPLTLLQSISDKQWSLENISYHSFLCSESVMASHFNHSF